MSEIDEPEKVERRKTMDNIGRRRELADVALVLASIEGRRFYWRMMIRCGIFMTSMTGNNTTFYNEGQRNIGLIMLADMNEADPAAYLKCVTEAKQQEATNR